MRQWQEAATPRILFELLAGSSTMALLVVLVSISSSVQVLIYVEPKDCMKLAATEFLKI